MMSNILSDKIDSLKRFLLRRYYGRSKLEISELVSMQLCEETGQDIFFGYYDISPFSSDFSSMLAGRRAISYGKRAKGTALEIGYFAKENDGFLRFSKLGETQTWCWQQGARLQWIPGSNDVVLYNCLVKGQYGAVIQDIKTKEIISEITMPVYALASNGQDILSLNFSRLQNKRQGYGYSNLADSFSNELCPSEDGVWKGACSRNDKELIFSLKQAADLDAQPSMDGAYHYFNHLCWNPSANRFLVFHLWESDKGRFVRLLTLGSDGKQAWAFNECRASHYWWLNDEEFILYGTHDRLGEGYFKCHDQKGVLEHIGEGKMGVDGHPSVDKSGRWMLSDTVSNRFAERDLFLYDLLENKKIPISSVFSPTNFRHERKCDLHPRWSEDGLNVCIDTTLTGQRSMAVFDVSKIVSAG